MIVPRKYFLATSFVEYDNAGNIVGYGKMGLGNIEDRIAMGHKLLVTPEGVTDQTHRVENGKLVAKRTKNAKAARAALPTMTSRKPLQVDD